MAELAEQVDAAAEQQELLVEQIRAGKQRLRASREEAEERVVASQICTAEMEKRISELRSTNCLNLTQNWGHAAMPLILTEC